MQPDPLLPALVDAARAAIIRARAVFMVINVVGVILLACQFNGLLSWDRTIADARLNLCLNEVAWAMAGQESVGLDVDKPAIVRRVRHLFRTPMEVEPRVCLPPPAGIGPCEPSTLTAAVGAAKLGTDELVRYREWGEFRCQETWEREISSIYQPFNDAGLPLIGLRFRASDLSLVGSVFLLVLCLWYYYVIRRENHAVAALADEALRELKDKRERVRFAFGVVAQYFVFATATDNDLPADGRTFVRLGFRVVNYIPFWVPLVAALADGVSLFWPDWSGHRRILDYAVVSGVTAQIVWRLGCVLAISAAAGGLCRRCALYEADTRAKMRAVEQASPNDRATMK